MQHVLCALGYELTSIYSKHNETKAIMQTIEQLKNYSFTQVTSKPDDDFNCIESLNDWMDWLQLERDTFTNPRLAFVSGDEVGKLLQEKVKKPFFVYLRFGASICRKMLTIGYNDLSTLKSWCERFSSFVDEHNALLQSSVFSDEEKVNFTAYFVASEAGDRLKEAKKKRKQPKKEEQSREQTPGLQREVVPQQPVIPLTKTLTKKGLMLKSEFDMLSAVSCNILWLVLVLFLTSKAV